MFQLLLIKFVIEKSLVALSSGENHIQMPHYSGHLLNCLHNSQNPNCDHHGYGFS